MGCCASNKDDRSSSDEYNPALDTPPPRHGPAHVITQTQSTTNVPGLGDTPNMSDPFSFTPSGSSLNLVATQVHEIIESRLKFYMTGILDTFQIRLNRSYKHFCNNSHKYYLTNINYTFIRQESSTALLTNNTKFIVQTSTFYGNHSMFALHCDSLLYVQSIHLISYFLYIFYLLV